MTQLQEWTVHDEYGSRLGTFPHPVFADIFASTLADITGQEYIIRDSESPAQKVVRFLEEANFTKGERS